MCRHMMPTHGSGDSEVKGEAKMEGETSKFIDGTALKSKKNFNPPPLLTMGTPLPPPSPMKDRKIKGLSSTVLSWLVNRESAP